MKLRFRCRCMIGAAKTIRRIYGSTESGSAVAMVTRMDALFLIDRDARRRELSADERQAQRGEHAKEWLQDIRQACLALAQQALPKSAFAQAAAYTLNMWAKLRRCFDYG
jgi:hypothetical protein